MISDLVAQGWRRAASEGFIEHVGGLWRRSLDGKAEFGFLAQDMHANRNGVVHGGMLMTFVDRAFGETALEASGVRRTATVSLAHEFMAPMRLGSFATLRPRVVKVTSRLAFLQGTVVCGDEAIVTAQGVWRLAREG